MAETKKFCIHSDGLGYCDILSDDETRQYCVEGPCPHEKIVEYAPVRYGRWLYSSIKNPRFRVCDQCACAVVKMENQSEYNYCPNCGAKMEVDNG